MIRTRKIQASFAHIVLFLYALTAVGPFIFLVRASFLGRYALFQNFWSGLGQLTLANYGHLLFQSSFLRWTINTLIYAGVVTTLKIFMDTLAAYSFARKKFPGANFLFALILGTMMVPPAVLMIPLFYLLVRLDWINTYHGLILPMLANPFGIFMMRQFIVSLPVELEDAARIDGCSELAVFWKITFPLCKPGIAALAIVTFMWQWTAFFWPLVITSSDEMRTLTVGLSTMPTQYDVNWGLITAGSFSSVIPIVAIFFLYQRGFIEGLTFGALKG